MKQIVILFLALTNFFAIQGQTKNFIDQPYIEVEGIADTLIVPNKISIKIIISEYDTKDKISIEEIENKMVSALQSVGINTEKKLYTSTILSNFKYHLFKQKNILKTKEYILLVENELETANVFGVLEEIGISNTSIDKIESSQINELENKCRTKAVQNAYYKAQEMVKMLNQNIGKAIFISDNESSNGVQYMIDGIKVQTRKREAKLSNFEFEKINIKVKVNVKFILL